MIHPSYVELMQVVNSDQTEIGEEPVINSRYSIVIATGDEPMIAKAGGRKPLSAAVQELYEGKVKIVGQDDTIDEMKDKKRLSEARADSVKESGQDTQDNQETGDLDEMAQADEMEEMSEM